jgi:hypothetical protein
MQLSVVEVSMVGVELIRLKVYVMANDDEHVFRLKPNCGVFVHLQLMVFDKIM